MFESLNQSYPFNNNFKHNVKTIGLVSMGFVLIVLYFQPFGINFLRSANDGYFVLAAAFLSAISLFGNTLLLPGLLPSIFNPYKWTIRKEMIWNVWLFSNLFIIFFLLVWYVRKVDFTDLPFFRTAALAVLPLVLLNIINYNHSLKDKVVSVIDSGRHWFKEEKLPVNGREIEILAENGKDVFKAPLDNVLLFHSSGNYIEIFLKHNQGLRKKLFRQTLANVEGYLSSLNDFKKCHRCWLVNTQKIKAISGNSKGYFLLIEGVEFKIPVSRNFIADFRNSEI
jgi:hypothetical protein